MRARGARFAVVMLVGAAWAVPAIAGGFVGIRPISAPKQMVAGESRLVSFRLENRDHTPMRGLSPVVVLTQGTDRLEVPTSETEPGRYTARVRVAAPGRWNVTIDSRLCGNVCRLAPVAVTAAAR